MHRQPTIAALGSAPFLLLGLSGLLCIARAADAPNATLTADPAAYSLTSDRAEYLLGENVILSLNLLNKGANPIMVTAGGDYRGGTRAHRFTIEATDQQGRKAEDPVPDEPIMGGFLQNSSILPGKTYTEKLSLTRYCRINRPGTYHIVVQRGAPYPAEDLQLAFKIPSPSEAQRILTDLESPIPDPDHPSARPRPGDYSSLQIPLYVGPLTTLAEKGDRWALLALGNMANQEATEALINIAGEADESLAIDAVAQLTHRMPWSWVFMEGQKTHDQLVAASWNARFVPRLRQLAINWLTSSDPKLVGAGADLMRSVADPADDHYLYAALTRIISPPGVPKQNPSPGNYPQPIAQLLGAMYGLSLRGHVFSQASLAEPGALLAYFNSLRAKPGPRPREWKRHFDENYRNPILAIRVAALYSLPYPVPADCMSAVDSERSDPDEEIKAAVLFATERKVVISSPFPNMPPQVIQIPTDTESGK